jgi:hypothetical protein
MEGDPARPRSLVQLRRGSCRPDPRALFITARLPLAFSTGLSSLPHVLASHNPPVSYAMANRKRELGHTPDSLIASPSTTEGVRDKALPALPVSAAEDERMRLAERNRQLKLLKPDRPSRVSFISEISTDDGLDIPTPKENPALLLRPTRAAAQSRLGAHISWASDVTSTTASSIGLGLETEVKNDAPAVLLVPVVYDKSTPRSSIAPKSARTSMTTISSEGGESGRALERGPVYTHSNLSTECILLAEHLGFDDGPSTPELSGEWLTISCNVICS